LNLRLKEENQIVFSFETLTDDDSIIVDELVLVAFNIRREVCDVLDSSLLFLIKYENSMISLMLDPRFKNFHIVSSFVG
jgi:hypothetical protein